MSIPASLTASTPQAGLELARSLAKTFCHQYEQFPQPQPGGTHYGQAALPSEPQIAGIFFVAVSLANGGWKS